MPRPWLAPVGQPPESALGQRLKAARIHYGLSVDALSRVTKAVDQFESRGVSATAMLRYEAGETLPGARELRLLCESLRVTADWFVLGRVIAGLDVEEQTAIAANRALHAHYHRKMAMEGEAAALTVEHAARQQWAQWMIEAKRRT